LLEVIAAKNSDLIGAFLFSMLEIKPEEADAAPSAICTALSDMHRAGHTRP